MQQRKRLLRANRKPLDSFDQAVLVQSPPSNLLENIKNHNLYLKLVGIALQLSKEAGVTTSALEEVQEKLLGVKGLQQHSMLNQDKEKQINRVGDINQNASYNSNKKYMTPEQQLSFLNKMEKQVQEVQAKQHVIYALKKYIEQKKKSIIGATQKQKSYNRAHLFSQKFRQKNGQTKIQRCNFYGQTLREIISRIQPKKSIVYETLKKMVHLKTIWGHTFFTEAEQQYCPVYNAIFDKSEKLIITGGEDGKIKTWSRATGAQISTLQGHKQYINKITVSNDNKIVLSAAQDGIRFFDLDNMNSLGGYQIESIMDIGQVLDLQKNTSSVIFANGEKLFVLPMSKVKSKINRKLQIYDFQVYNFKSKLNQNSGNTNTLTITTQGLVFLGFIQGQIILFDFKKLENAKIDEFHYGSAEGLDRIQEFELPVICVLNAHEGDILEIKWNPIMSCFSTGAKRDGVCKIWQFRLDQPERRPIVIKQLKIPKYKVKRKRKQYNCNFGCWNSTFTHITCSFEEQELEQQTQNRGDGEVIVYNAKRMEVTWQMSKTIDLSSIRAMDSHPYQPNIAAICDSFGKIIIVDIFQNCIINLFQERAFHLGHPAFCLVPSQCRFSQDGLTLLIASQYGNFSLYGYDIKSFYEIYPTEQKFKNDYEEFQIDPTTYKPILRNQLPIDVNDLDFGELQNMKHQSYQNMRPINAKKVKHQIDKNQSKQDHKNQCYIDIEQVERIDQCQSQFARSMEVFRQNMQEIENKRMTVLYEQGQSRDSKLRQLINQKIQRIKQVDQSISLSLLSNSLTSQNSYSHQGTQIYNGPTDNSNHNVNSTNSHGRRRGRRSTRNNQEFPNSRANRPSYAEYVDQVVQEENLQQQNEDEEQYQAQGSSQDEAQSFDQDDADEEFQEENESGQAYQSGYNSNANRRRRRQRSNRTSRVNTRHHNTNQPRRPARDVIEELEQQYEEYGRTRKRNALQINDESEQINNQQQEQSKRQLRKAANKTLVQLRSQKQYCNLCQFKQSTVECSECHQKFFCDGCKNMRGRRLEKTYTCYECLYQKNSFPEMHKNTSCQKYTSSSRSEELFIPQIGDEVVYFFQGYEEFLNDKIESLNNKFLKLDMQFDIVPHQKNTQLINIQKCQVTDINYAFPLEEDSHLSFKKSTNRARGRQQRSNLQDILMLVSLKSVTGTQFKVFFIPGYEYLIKWEIYDDIMRNDRYGKFNLYAITHIKDQQVQIEEVKPLNHSYSNSIWKNILVHKAETKFLRRRQKGDQIAVNIWNIDGFVDKKAFEYRTSFDLNWRQHYKRQIEKIQYTEPALWDIFSEPVDITAYPTYPIYVEVSMYLQLILSRLQNNYYATQKSFAHDIKLLVQNSISFNGKDSFITQMAQKLMKLILQGENYNNGNQLENSTQKKTKTKKKLNSGGSSAVNREDQMDKNRRKNEVRVSKFDEDAEVPVRRIKRNKRKVSQMSDDGDYMEESEQKYSGGNESSEQIMRPATRNRRRGDSNSYNQNLTESRRQNGRVTRSRTKN